MSKLKFRRSNIHRTRHLSELAKMQIVLALFAAVFCSSTVFGQTNLNCDQFYVRDPGQPFVEISVSERNGFLLAERYRVALLMMRDHPELIDKYDEALAERLLAAEKRTRAEMDELVKYPPLEPPFNTAHPAFNFEWSEIVKSQPNLASGQLLDVYLNRESPWPFLQRAPGWNERTPIAWVGIFLFPKAAEVDRDSHFAAREAASILKQQLQISSKRESTDLWFPLLISPTNYVYDPATQTLHIKTDLLRPRAGGTPVAGAQERAEYLLEPTKGSTEQQLRAGGFRESFPELETWRQMVGFGAQSEGAALDRQLRLNPVTIPTSAAEAARLTDPHTVLRLRLFLTIVRTEKEMGSESQFALVAKVKMIELVDDRGRVMATIPGSSLPLPNSYPVLAPDSVRPGFFDNSNATKGANCRALQASSNQTRRKVLAESAARKTIRAETSERNQACNRQAVQEADKAGPSPGPAWQIALKSARESCLVNGPNEPLGLDAAAAAQPGKDSGISPAVNAKSAADLNFDSLKANVVKIHTLRKPSDNEDERCTGDETGTGFVVSSDQGLLQILTARHVVCRADSVTVTFLSDRLTPISAKLLPATSEPLDLAVLEIRLPLGAKASSHIRPIHWAPRTSMAVPMNVWTINGDGEPVPNRLEKLDHESNINQFEYTANSIGEGYSGGPVLDDAGNLIGVHSASINRANYHRSLATFIEPAIETLESLGYTTVLFNQLSRQVRTPQ